MTNAPLPSDVLDLIAKGNKIEAIKMLRELTGMSLLDAKMAVDSVTEENRTMPFHAVPRHVELSSAVLHQLTNGKKIDAIRVLREETGMGLKDAKDAVEQGLLDHPDVKSQLDDITRQGIKKFFLRTAMIALIAYLLSRVLLPQ